MKFQLSYFKSWKIMLWKCCTQCASKFGKLRSVHRTGKGSVFIPIPLPKAMTKNAQTTAQLHSSHMLKEMLKILQARLQQYLNRDLLDVQAGFRKGEGARDQIANICCIIKKSKRVLEKHLLLLYWLCQRLCVDHNKLKNFLRDGNTRSPYLPPEKCVWRSRSNS